MKSVLLIGLGFLFGGFGVASASDFNPVWLDPLPDAEVVRPFDRDATKYGPGHRGVDLSGSVGAPVRAVASGTVIWAGPVAGRSTVTVDHGSERSTYEPLEVAVVVGERVAAGQLLGYLQAGHGACRSACLHLGRLESADYRDPAELLGRNAFRLISPIGPPPPPPFGAGGALPVAGPITSGFGPRVHPITKRRGFHDGVDIGAACRTPVPAIAAGRVVHAGSRGAYGQQVQIRHTARDATSYSHLAKINVKPGQSVRAGQIIGTVGNTGMSTGCHLHFMLISDGVPRDPLR